MKNPKKKRIVKIVAVLAVLVPCTALAFFGSEDAVLTAMLTELKSHTQSLFDLFDGISFLDSQVNNMREKVEEVMDLRTWNLIDRDKLIGEIIPSTETLYNYPFVHGLSDYKDMLKTVEDVWGKTLDSAYSDIQRFKDFIPTYTLGQTALIAEEAKDFAHTGEDLLDDLAAATEGKATVRAAQASALQVQQLAQIESNQALQISLQSQQVLSENQFEKGMQEVSSKYLKMLKNNYETLSEE